MLFDSLFVLTCSDDAMELAHEEVRAAAGDARELDILAPGVVLWDAGQPFAELAAHWAEQPPIFVRHICPVQLAAPLYGHVGDLGALAEQVRAALTASGDGSLARLDPSLPFSVQSRVLAELAYKPFDINDRLAAVITEVTGARLDVRAPAQVLSVVCAPLASWRPPSAGAGRAQRPDRAVAYALLGVSPVALNLSDWAGGMRRFAREVDQISRAEFKLLEALEIFAIDLPLRGVALDLGASPGGWTRVLRQRGQYVTAVDPGELDPRLANDRAVRHKPMTAEEYLRSDPDRFDLIVNDMRMDGRDSARLMVSYAPYLYRTGCAIMTVKLPEQHRQPVLDHTFTILRQAYQIVGARQLFHNRSEITVYLRPLPAAAR
ncbi:MAG: 50S rRNA methyltransferase [Caldilineaceae bacterium]|nr:50S rRNA methyltransferase [Caldilineaceae bacterium]